MIGLLRQNLMCQRTYTSYMYKCISNEAQPTVNSNVSMYVYSIKFIECILCLVGQRMFVLGL